MDSLSTTTTVITTGLTLAALQIGLFVWLKNDIGALAERIRRVEHDVAFLRGQMSLVLPSLTKSSTAESAAPR